MSDLPGPAGPPSAAGGAALFWARRLSRRAPIFLGPGVPAAPLGAASVAGALLGNRRACSLVMPSSTLEKADVLAATVAAYRRHHALYPEHRVVILCSTPAEILRLQAHDVPAVLGHQNILVREATFAIDARATKQYDAIYVGQMHPAKRHALCRDIASLALVYYPIGTGAQDYLASMRALLPRAEFVNETWARSKAVRLAHPRAQALAQRALAEHGYVVLAPEEVAAACNSARVGLCLSAEEGAMYASMEYLLCGLPVVTTASRGGRDFFFDPDVTLTVADDPAAVRDGVAALIARAIPPERVRAATLRKVAHERARLRAFLQALFDAEGVGDELDEAWAALFAGPIWHWHGAETLLEPRIEPPATR